MAEPRTRSHTPLMSAAVVGALLILASLLPQDLATDLAVRDQGPSGAHWLGTDHLGRDVVALTLRGIRNSALVGVNAAVISGAVGLVIGVAMGLGPRGFDAVGMRLVEITDTVPTLLLAIMVTALLGPSPGAIVATIALTHWSRLARIIRVELSSLRSRDWITAAIGMGATRWHVAREHVLPAVAGQVAIAVLLAIPGAIGHESTLSFLGLGFPPGNPSLGTLLADAPAALARGQVWPVVAPTVALVLLCLVGIVHQIAKPHPATTEQPNPDAQPQPTGEPRPADAIVTLTGLSVTRGGNPVLRGVDLVLRPGEFVVLLGESGAGKSTLLQAMVGVLPGPAEVSGSIRYRRTDAEVELLGLTGKRRRMMARSLALVPQSAQTALPPTQRLGRTLASAAGNPARAEESLRRVGLDPELAGHYPHQLSGGQARRGLLALALAGEPEVLVVDEPTVGLDREAAGHVLQVLQDECRRGLCVLVPTHDTDLLLDLADRVLVLADGRISPLTQAQQSPHHRVAAPERVAHA